jgi:hypothetical protein
VAQPAQARLATELPAYTIGNGTATAEFMSNGGVDNPMAAQLVQILNKRNLRVDATYAGAFVWWRLSRWMESALACFYCGVTIA